MNLLLASTSPARGVLMDGLGVAYRAEAPGVKEEVAAGTPVEQAVRELAERKARAVWARHPEAFVLGADQLVSLDGKALGKPANRQAALEQLSALRGRAHEILTGVCLVGPGFREVEVDVAKLTVFALSDEELEAYVDTGEWQGCAGGYRVEGRGQWLFEDIQGDRTSIQGLPMLRVVRMLRAARLAP